MSITFDEHILALKYNDTIEHHFIRGNNYDSLPFSSLYHQAVSLAYSLSLMGVLKNKPVGLVLNQPDEFIIAFLACTMIGAPSVPMATPGIGYKSEVYGNLINKILKASRAENVIVSQDIHTSIIDLTCNNIRVIPFQLTDCVSSASFSPVINASDDTCFYQFTSGSTGNPKGVIVSYDNLLNNIKGMADRIQLSASDQVVSWLPLYHDMGLIAKVILPLILQVSVAYIPTSMFIKNPKIWFKTIAQFKATISFVPNFALSLIYERYKHSDLNNVDLHNVDLHSLRAIGCGAEPINAKLVEKFLSRFEVCGLKKTVFLPCYGMAEATLGMTMSQPGSLYNSIYIDKENYMNNRVVVINKESSAPGILLVSCGTAIDNHSIKIVNKEGEDVGSDVVGRVVFKGPSVTRGYVHNDAATQLLYQNDWLNTGDLGFIHQGEVYISGRIKDVIIINGRNIYPQDVESYIDLLDVTRIGGSVAFEVDDGALKSYVIVCEVRKIDPYIKDNIVTICRQQIGVLPKDIVFVKRGAIPKTTSGKVKRAESKNLYLNALFKRLTG